MCGILAILGRQDLLDPEDIKRIKSLIDNRGPDYQSDIIEYSTPCGLVFSFAASILQLTGKELQTQPLKDSEGNVLLFNGHIYRYLRLELDSKLSDTTFLANKLADCRSRQEISETLALVDGPFAFIYWHQRLRSLVFGRDFFGRKSLCSLSTKDGCLVALSSIGPCASFSPDSNLTWSEVDCSGFHFIDYTTGCTSKTTISWRRYDIYPETHESQNTTVLNNPELIQHLPLSPLNNNLKSPDEFSSNEFKVAADQLGRRILAAVSRRLNIEPKQCLDCRKTKQADCEHSKVAVAFSGGIDSTLVALALHKMMNSSESIDLLSVAFKPDSPDRRSVADAFDELKTLCPSRKWRLVLCDITKSELRDQRETVIRHLIYPCRSVIDDSLGCGCWYIARGEGRALYSDTNDCEFNLLVEKFTEYLPNSPDVPESSLQYLMGFKEFSASYRSTASIIFAGMSIDEQLGGYSSFRSVWKNESIPGLFKEISFQMRRLSIRNLGRDDRTMSDHGREVKLPYLDCDLVSYLNELPIGLKMNLDDPIEKGPKKLLRELALSWGLIRTSTRVKRALQFGTRIANLEDSKEKGADVCSRLI